jgi:hypothetical protein
MAEENWGILTFKDETTSLSRNGQQRRGGRFPEKRKLFLHFERELP